MWERLRSKLFHLNFLLTRPLTVGARGIIVDENDRVLLVKHTYSEGWFLPGGGVEVGESAEEAVRREMLEEVGIVAGEIRPLSVFHNKTVSSRDHVVIYAVLSWREMSNHQRPQKEIIDSAWLEVSDLHNRQPLSACTLHGLRALPQFSEDNVNYFSHI